MTASSHTEQTGIISRFFERSPTLFIGLSFALIFAVMMSLVLLSLNRLGAMHGELENVIAQHNSKIELVQTMRFVVRERLIAIHQLVIEDDPFQRDEIIMHFTGMASLFVEARDKLQMLAHSPQEQQMLDDLRKLTAIGTPFQEGVLELMNKDDMAGARTQLKEKAMPAQLDVVRQCDSMLEYYKKIAQEVEARAHAAHEKTTFLLLLLGGMAAAISFFIALMVLTRTKKDRDALLNAHDELEEQVAQRTEELRLSVVQLAEAQRISHIGHWEWQLQNKVMSWSDEVFRMLGYVPQSLNPSFETLLNAIVPNDRERLKTAIEHVMVDRAPIDFEYRIVQANGNERVVHQQASVDFDQDGTLLKILGTMQDVTESKAAEQKLRLAARVFNSAGEGIIITDANNNIVDVNRAFTEISGFSKEEVVGQNPRMFKSGKHEPAFYREMWAALLATGSWRGELWGLRKSGAIYPKWQTISTIRDDSGKFTNYLSIFRDISDAKKHEEHLWELAHFDSLCGVANRSLMYANLRQSIAHARREKHLLALMMIDLDHFKTINDTLGHDAGDQLLVHVANQLKASIRESDTVARLGGDEFIVILSDMQSREAVLSVTAKIRKALGSSLTLKNGEIIVVSASIGIAIFPEDATEIEMLMKCADHAMYHAKELGRNNAQLFREGLSQETRPESPPA